MIQLVYRNLTKDTLDYLKTQQAKIDNQSGFALKTEKAQLLWNSKTASDKGKRAFAEIVQTLSEMCISISVCNYCEQNEANDIEHIAPKSFFPDKTFHWENYLLACKQCNTAYKLDKFAVLNENDDIIPCVRKEEPLYDVCAFINPRIQNPSDYMLISTSTFTFMLLPELSKRMINQASMTIDILQLNNRDTLIHARKEAAKYYFQTLKLLINILDAESIEDIKDLIGPYAN